MESAQSRYWPSLLPLVGSDIEVHLQNEKMVAIPHGRICGDETMIHINVISEAAQPGSFPIITETKEFNLGEIIALSFNDGYQRRSFFGRSTFWLRNLPKSKGNTIFLLCDTKNQMLCVENCWIEYDEKKIYLREIFEFEPATHCEILSHERQISEVIAILINKAGIPPILYARVSKI